MGRGNLLLVAVSATGTIPTTGTTTGVFVVCRLHLSIGWKCLAESNLPGRSEKWLSLLRAASGLTPVGQITTAPFPGLSALELGLLIYEPL